MSNTTRWSFGIKKNTTIDTGPNKQVSGNIRGINEKMLLIVCEVLSNYLDFCRKAELIPGYDALHFRFPDMVRGSHFHRFHIINLDPMKTIPQILQVAYYELKKLNVEEIKGD